jgi:hypothetical protein
MMSTEEGNYYGLDPVGRRIWEIIGEPLRHLCRAANRLLRARRDVRGEVPAFVKELVEHRVVHVVAN